MSASKSERILNLLIALLSTNRFLSKQELREMVEGYKDVRSFDRTFERDKDELRSLGIPIEMGSNDVLSDDADGYRINRAEYELPEIDFTGEELVAIGLAAHAWQSSVGAESTAAALQRLRAAGAAPDVSRLPRVLAQIPVTESAFDPIYEALFRRHTVTFEYAGRLRQVQPWRLYQRRGQWLLLGQALDVDAPRRFKLHRIRGEVQQVGAGNAYEIPSDVSEYLESPPEATAVLAIRDVPELIDGAEPIEWDGLPDGFSAYRVSRLQPQMICDDVMAASPDAFVLEPSDIRDAVIERLRSAAEVRNE